VTHRGKVVSHEPERSIRLEVTVAHNDGDPVVHPHHTLRCIPTHRLNDLLTYDPTELSSPTLLGKVCCARYKEPGEDSHLI
jgi:hypothetical protein